MVVVWERESTSEDNEMSEFGTGRPAAHVRRKVVGRKVKDYLRLPNPFTSFQATRGMPRTAGRAKEPVYFTSPAAFGLWLKKNHAKETELWVGFFKKHTGRQVLSISTATDEALCWGWINGVTKGVDGDRVSQRFTPRKTKSHWSKVNVDKVALLEAAGRMQEPGRAAFALRTEENTAQMTFEREAIPLSKEFTAQLAGASDAAEWHARQPPGYRRDADDWVMSAKQQTTRERRLGVLIESAQQGLRIPPLRRK